MNDELKAVKAAEAATVNAGPPSTAPNCLALREIEAVILFPSLGAPQILPSNAQECTIIVATDSEGASYLSNSINGAILVNHHLRLNSFYASKNEEPPVTLYHLHPAMDGKSLLREKARSFFEITELRQQSDALYLLDDHASKYIGNLSVDARMLYQEGGRLFNRYFAITIKQLQSIVNPISAEAQSWMWMVSTQKAHLVGIKDDKTNPLLVSNMKLHQPGDRMLWKKLRELGDLGECDTAEHFFVDAPRLFAIDPSAKTNTPNHETDAPNRIQLWHPVKFHDAPLKFAHLTDTHINVRQASLARSKARIVEGQGGKPHLDPIGPRVSHAYANFRDLIDNVVGKADALMLTGDFIDFNRNILPLSDAKAAKLSIGDWWQRFNVFTNAFEPEGPYRRGLDYVYFYSLVLNAAKCNLLSFIVTGNHEGYQWPYGISPRVSSTAKTAPLTTANQSIIRPVVRDTKDTYNLVSHAFSSEPAPRPTPPVEPGHPVWDFSAALNVYVGNERSAFEALEPAKATGDKFKIARAQRDHDRAVQDLRQFQEATVEQASQWHQTKATECIPSDHNLTIYEAILAFGPAYGQTLTTHNFRHTQLNFIHWVMTPFTDLNLYPGCADLLGKGAKQVVTLLGWGKNERLLPEIGDLVARKIAPDTAQKNSEERRGAGFLPYAIGSINPSQHELLNAASEKQCNWVVASHFTVASFQESVPLGVSTETAGFCPCDTVKNDEKATPNRLPNEEKYAQYNFFNWGGCELGLKTYIENYVAMSSNRVAERYLMPGRVNVHFSGHSHRAGVYSLDAVPRGSILDAAVSIACRVPGIDGPYGWQGTGKGTQFIVGSTDGQTGPKRLRDQKALVLQGRSRFYRCHEKKVLVQNKLLECFPRRLAHPPSIGHDRGPRHGGHSIHRGQGPQEKPTTPPCGDARLPRNHEPCRRHPRNPPHRLLP